MPTNKVYVVDYYIRNGYDHTVTTATFATRNAALLWITKQPNPNSYGCTGHEYRVCECPVFDAKQVADTW